MQCKNGKARSCSSWLFLFRSGQGGLILRLIAMIISIQPFANIVGGYACHERDYERNKMMQCLHLLSVPVSEVATYSIIYLKILNYQYFCPIQIRVLKNPEPYG